MPVDHRRLSGHASHERHEHEVKKPPSSISSRRRPSSNTTGRRTPSAPSRNKTKDQIPQPEPEVTDKKEAVEEPKVEEPVVDKNEAEINGNEGIQEVEEPKEEPEPKPASPDPDANQNKWGEKSKSEEFIIKSFNDNIMEFTEIFDSDKFRTVDQDFPIDELFDVVATVSKTIDDFKKQTLDSQSQLEGLREKMKQVKEGIHFSVTRNAMEFSNDGEIQSIEERELTEKLQRLNAEVAKANAELSEALRLSAETERTAVTAQLAAEKAKEEARRIEEELELKARVEARRKVEGEKRMEEARKKREEEERQEAERRKAKEAEWRRKVANGTDKPAIWEKWPTCEFTINSDTHDLGVGCIVRGNPTTFDQSKMSVEVVDQQESKLSYKAQEELVSCILRFDPQNDNKELQEPIFVAIPFVLSRSALMSREPFVKAEVDGEWRELPSKEVAFENHKDVKFLQAEITQDTKMAVMTRFKQDYVTLTKRPVKITSSYDQRVTLTVQKDTFKKKELFRMQIQPVDSATVHELQLRRLECKGLLTCSPIIQTDWETQEFHRPVTITIPCPPNPAKARKLAQIRKMKEEKMKTPQKLIPVPLEVKDEKEEKRKRLQQAQQQLQQPTEETETARSPTKWYMGEYGHNDDDENDNLYLVSRSKTGRWTVHTDTYIQQVKLDLLQLDLSAPAEKLMVLRTRTNILEEAITPMAKCIFDFLAKRFAQVIIKQRSDDPFDVLVSIVPVSKTDKALKRLNDSGFDEGPEPSSIVTVNEGDVIEITFRGNITNSKDQALKIIYNSNITSEVRFYASEVDQYLQKNFSVYRGMVQLHRCYCDVPAKKQLRKQTTAEELDVSGVIETKRDMLCELSFTIPKYHIEPPNVPTTAPVTIIPTTDPVDADLIRDLARDMGDEWRRIAQALNVSRARIQAIIRNVQAGERTEEDIRFEVLMSWLKKMPKITDKVTLLSDALIKGGRADLAEDVQEKGRDFRTSRLAGRS